MINEPLVRRAVIAGAVTLITSLLAVFDVPAVGGAAAATAKTLYVTLPLVIWCWAILSARSRVTPVENATDYAGNRLVPPGLRLDVGDSDDPLDDRETQSSDHVPD